MMTPNFEIAPAPSPVVPAAVQIITAEVDDDARAIRIFLDGYKRRSIHTIRSYEKECYRFLLWLRSMRGSGNALLPTVGVEDINSYLEFVSNPRPFSEEFLRVNGWSHQPFRNALSKAASLSLCVTVLHRLFTAMREMRGPGGQPYCTYNPTNLTHEGLPSRQQDEEVEQALTNEEWAAVQEVIEGLPQASERERKHYHRARWLLQLLYRAFLRREEAANLIMENFEASPQGWSIRLTGKGEKGPKLLRPTYSWTS